MKNGISSLWKNEDWRAVWFGFILIIGALAQWIPSIPKIGVKQLREKAKLRTISEHR